MKQLFYHVIVMSVLLLAAPSLSAQYAGAPHGLTFKRLFINHAFPYEDDIFEEDFHTVGVELGYQRHLNPYLNLAVPLRIGIADYYEAEDVNLPRPEEIFLGLDATLQLKYFKEGKWFAPYLLAGIGGEIENWDAQRINAYLPLGAGLNIRLTQGLYVNVQSEYRYGFTDLRTNLTHSIGGLVILGEGTPPPPPPPIEVAPPDADNDGIADNDDDCPNEAGLAKFGGCPDTDGDNIVDKDDECPTVAGLPVFNGCPDTDGDGLMDSADDCPNQAGPAENRGCPLQDADGDGVADGQDKCPNEAGLARFDGCPDTDGDGVPNAADRCPNKAGLQKNAGCPDTDGDTVVDPDDKCPSEAGPASNKGCPEIKKEDKEILSFAVQAVEFESGRATLKITSNAVLDKIVSIMSKYGGYSLTIAGHTDSVGDSNSNQILSENRAKACYTYLLSKGVSSNRMNYIGLGESTPIADNKYKDGRQKNRRVEFDLNVK